MSTRAEVKLLLVLGGVILIAAGLISKKGERIRGLAFIAAWMLPGAGHLLLGRWKKGLFFFGLLAATYAFGMWIAGWRPVSFDDNPFYFVGQYGSGLTLLIAKLRGAEKAIVGERIHPGWFDPGLLYVCVVGLLNLVIMLNILDLKIAGASAAPAPLDKPAAPAAATAPAPAPEKTA
ncbi:MAG: hypothetical protein HY293_13175 [Planctomycetes bacterium]|nr:hypothetical protein [Planctomycetota bacterium]